MTSFVIESYRWIQQDSTDQSLLVLKTISLQIGGFNTSTSSPPAWEAPLFKPDPINIRINILWFLSLTLSLTTVLIGILCLQWLREYQRHAGTLPDQATLLIRQMRFDGLHSWGVPSIISALPILLQAALVLFFVGLIDFLRALNVVIAIPVVISITLVLIFMLVTTIAPAFQACKTSSFIDPIYRNMSQCAYKSPQSWLFVKVFSLMASGTIGIVPLAAEFVAAILRTVGIKSHSLLSNIKERSASFRRQRWTVNQLGGWLGYDDYWRSFRERLSKNPFRSAQPDVDLPNALTWVNYMFRQRDEVVLTIHHAIRALRPVDARAVVTTIYPTTEMCKRRCDVVTDASMDTLTEEHISLMLSSVYLDFTPIADIQPKVRNFVIEAFIRYMNMADRETMFQGIDITYSSEGIFAIFPSFTFLLHRYHRRFA